MQQLGRETVAVVLAGGLGTRLGALTRNRCKPALHIGGRYRSIDFTLSNCVNSGVRQIGVATQYQSQSVIRHIHQSWGFLNRELGEFVEIWPAGQRLDSNGSNGTADAVYQNLAKVDHYRPRYVLVLAADHVYRMNYGDLLEFHRESGAGVTVACHRVPADQARHFGIMSVDHDEVRTFDEKPQCVAIGSDPLASMGIYVFDADLLRELLTEDAACTNSKHDFGRDLIPGCVKSSDIRVCAYPLRDPCTGGPGYWRDIGTVDAYWSANMELLSPSLGFDLRDPRWPIRSTQDRSPPTCVLPQGECLPTLVSGSIVGNGCQFTRAAVHGSILCDNVHVGPGSVIEDSILLPGARVGADCQIRRAIVEENVALPAGTWLGDNEVPDAGLCEVSDNGITVLYGFDELMDRRRDFGASPAGRSLEHSALRYERTVKIGVPEEIVRRLA
jgi:glucose-1-phosphate adenylyltransferase